MTISKSDLLDLAKAVVADRGLNHGKPEDNFLRIASLWNAHIGNRPHKFLTAVDVAIMCALIKIARIENQDSHLDSWIDLAGYAACGANIACEDPNAKPR